MLGYCLNSNAKVRISNLKDKKLTKKLLYEQKYVPKHINRQKHICAQMHMHT